jgi:hypothetical protein
MKVLRPDDGVMMKLTQFNLNYVVTLKIDNGITGTLKDNVITVAADSKISEPSTAGLGSIEADHRYAWYNGETEFNFDTPITSDLILTVKSVEKQ